MDYREKNLTPIKDILSEILENQASPLGGGLFRILRFWDHVVGSAIAEHARPFRFKEGQLDVRVSDPIWLQELTYREPEIRDKLNQGLGQSAVRKIAFKMGL